MESQTADDCNGSIDEEFVITEGRLIPVLMVRLSLRIIIHKQILNYINNDINQILPAIKTPPVHIPPRNLLANSISFF